MVFSEKFTFARWSRNALNLRNAKISHQTDRIQPRGGSVGCENTHPVVGKPGSTFHLLLQPDDQGSKRRSLFISRHNITSQKF